MSVQFNESDYYSFQRILSYNKLFNFIVGARGVGKTYGAKSICTNRWLKHHKQFIYLRRWQNDFFDMSTFYNDIQNNKYRNNSFVVKSNKIKMDDQLIGYYYPLSTAYKLKSNSSAFQNVSTIVFDEFIAETGRIQYINSHEVQDFLDFYETVARSRDVQVIFMANSISQANPYFEYFDIFLKSNQHFYKRPNIIVERTELASFASKKKQTAFGQIIANSKYEKYAIDNYFREDNNNFIQQVNEPVITLAIMKYNGHSYGVTQGIKSKLIYFIDRGYNEEGVVKYAITDNDHNLNYELINKSNRLIKYLIEAYNKSLIRFNSYKAKVNFMEITTLI